MKDVLDSIGFDRAKAVLDYYFKTGKNKHPLNFFYNNFERLESMMVQIDEDKANGSRVLEATRRRAEES